MKNKRFDGNLVTITAGAIYSAGDIVIQGDYVGVAVNDIANGAEGVIDPCGAFELAKTTGTAYTVGQRAYWDTATAKVVVVPGADTVFVGKVFVAAASGDALCIVYLTGTFPASNGAGIADLNSATLTPVTGNATGDINAALLEQDAVNTAIDAKLNAILAAIQ